MKGLYSGGLIYGRKFALQNRLRLIYLEGKLRLKKNLNLIVGRKFMIVYSIVAKVTGEKRGAPERVWVQGG